MRSAIYEGRLDHRRVAPVEHAFSYRVAMPYLDLDEIDEVFALHPLWSTSRRRPAAVRFRRDDYLGPHDLPLDHCVRDLVEDRIGIRPTGRIAMLAHLRALGWCFNPIVAYYCEDADGELSSFVADLTTTPWAERHAYVVDARAPEHRVEKTLHVSPFLPMDVTYDLRFTRPGERLEIAIADEREGRTIFGARLQLRRREITRSELTRMIVRYPLHTWRVSAGIYAHAWRLWRKGAPYHPHPAGKKAHARLRERLRG